LTTSKNSRVSGTPSEAEFIYYGIVKDGWKHQAVGNIQDILDDPRILDDDPDDFVECFFRYYSWYWENQRNGTSTDREGPPWVR